MDQSGAWWINQGPKRSLGVGSWWVAKGLVPSFWFDIICVSWPSYFFNYKIKALLLHIILPIIWKIYLLFMIHNFCQHIYCYVLLLFSFYVQKYILANYATIYCSWLTILACILEILIRKLWSPLNIYSHAKLVNNICLHNSIDFTLIW